MIAASVLLATLAGCQQKMAAQPYYRPYEPSAFFPDGMSARPFPDGVVAREWIRDADPLQSGVKPGTKATPAPAGQKKGAVPKDAPSTPDKFVEAFPFDLTRDDVIRGQERYTIYCAVCHDPLGRGNGKIVERGFTQPPNLIKDFSRGFSLYRIQVPLREVPVGYIFEVVSRGFGAMPRYGPQIPPKDRWRIVAYVRALQISQHAVMNQLPQDIEKRVREQLGGGK
jgi:mono/diheme cytochrome c family protein